MIFCRAAVSFLIFLALSAGGEDRTVYAGSSAEEPRTVALLAGEEVIHVRVARTPEELEKGFKGRDFLPDNEGMLFILPKEKNAFHMKGVSIPLSIAFIDRRGRILKIEEMDPEVARERIHEAPEGTRFALEMKRGWFRERDIKEGDRIRRKK